MARARLNKTYESEVTNVCFRPGELLPRLRERADRPYLTEHQVAVRDLERYYMLISANPPPEVTDDERKVLRKAIKRNDLALLWAEVADLGATDLALRIRRMDPLALVTLADSVERDGIHNG